MKHVKILFIFLLFISCQGQERNEKKTPKHEVKVNVKKEYKNQKNRFEIKGYKLFYNEQLLKSDTVKSVFKILGQPKYPDEIYYIDKPLSLALRYVVKKDIGGHRLFINKKDNKIYSLSDSNIEEYNIYGTDLYHYDKQGDTLKIITKYRIILKKHTPGYVPSKRDSILMQIPAMDGYVKVNGFYINKSTSQKELIKILKPTVKNADFLNSRGTISTWYYGTEKDEPLTKFDPRMTPAFDGGYIRIDYVYFDDEFYAIDYYYSILE